MKIYLQERNVVNGNSFASIGHDFSADIWSFGILVYELLTKTTPFYANDDVKVYENILDGIEGVKFHKKVPKYAEVKTRSSAIELFFLNMKHWININRT